MPRYSIPLAVPTEPKSPIADKEYTFIENAYVERSEAEQFHVVKRPALIEFDGNSVWSATQTVIGAVFLPDEGVNGETWLVVYDSSGGGSTQLYSLINAGVSPQLQATFGNTWLRNTDMIIVENAAGAKAIFISPQGRTFSYLVTTSTVTVTLVSHGYTGAGFNSTAFLDGYVFFIDQATNRIYNSALGDPTTWSGLDWIEPSSVSDKLVHIVRYRNHLVAFGTQSIEFFYDAGNPSGSPLAPRQDLARGIGIYSISVDSKLFALEDSDFIAFLARTSGGHVFAAVLDGFSVSPISSSYITRAINDDAGTLLSLGGFVSAGKIFVVVAFSESTDPVAFMYSTESGMWSWLSSSTFGYIGTPTNWVALRHVTVNAPSGYGRTSMLYSTTLWSDIKLPFYLDGGTYQDQTADGVNHSFDVIIQTPRWRGPAAEHNVTKFLTEITWVGDRQASGSIGVQWSDDDYQTFSSARSMALDSHSALNRCGRFYERAFKITYSGNTPMRLERLELDILGGVATNAP